MALKDSQIAHPIDKMLPYKATALGTTPNCILKEAKDFLIPYLSPLFWATFDLEYYPLEWAEMLNTPNTTNGEDGMLFVDDTMLLTEGADYVETHKKIDDMLHRDGGSCNGQKSIIVCSV
jgi:hypothetical protein